MRSNRYLRYVEFFEPVVVCKVGSLFFCNLGRQEASRIFGMGKETTFHKTCTDDYLELTRDQEVIQMCFFDSCPWFCSIIVFTLILRQRCYEQNMEPTSQSFQSLHL